MRAFTFELPANPSRGDMVYDADGNVWVFLHDAWREAFSGRPGTPAAGGARDAAVAAGARAFAEEHARFTQAFREARPAPRGLSLEAWN